MIDGYLADRYSFYQAIGEKMPVAMFTSPKRPKRAENGKLLAFDLMFT